MPLPTFPRSLRDKPDSILGLRGSFWDGAFNDDDAVANLLAIVAQVDAQGYRLVKEAFDAKSRFTVPVLARKEWRSLSVVESQVNSKLLTFGSGARFSQPMANAGEYAFGRAKEVQGYSVPLPSGLVDVSIITNRLSEPAVTLVRGIDFFVDDGYLVLKDNPFDSTEYERAVLYDENGEFADVEVTLWLFDSGWDEKYLLDLYGYVAGITSDSSESYKRMINALLDAYVGGSSATTLSDALSAMTGIPVCKDDGEEVVYVGSDYRGKVVVTDRSVYRFAHEDEIVVAIGDVLAAGQTMSTGLQILELTDGVVPEGLSAIQLTPGALPAAYVDGVVFRNVSVSLVVTEDEDGITKVSFELGGFPSDVDAFWDEVHSRGIAAGTTLASLLDLRPEDARDGNPQAQHLPTTINPLQFLVENVLRFNTILVRVNYSTLLDGMGMGWSRALRRVVPPWTAVLFLYDLENSETIVPTSGGNGAAGPSYSESVSVMRGNSLSETVSPGTLVTESVSAQIVRGICQ